MGCKQSNAGDSGDVFSIKTEKMRIEKPSKILLIGDSRIKIATALWLKKNCEVEVYVGTSEEYSPRNLPLRNMGIPLLSVSLKEGNSVVESLRTTEADVVYICTPSDIERTTMTISALAACKRSGVGHVVLLSSTVVGHSAPSIFGDQCKPIESYVKSSGLSYTIVRVPILLDNYLSQLDCMIEFGIFFRPLPKNCKRNSIAVADVGEASAKILMNPANYADKTINLNGCLCCDAMAADAFTKALGSDVLYEQIPFDDYRSTLLAANMPLYQVNGLLELFNFYEKGYKFSNASTKELEAILSRPPTDIYTLAETAMELRKLGQENNTQSNLRINRALVTSQDKKTFPPGIIGMLSVYSKKVNADQTNVTFLMGEKLCVVLDGVFTLVTVVAPSLDGIRLITSLS